jgi:hypothetical protein
VNSAQSGTWNINNVSGTVSLPTGAATESTLAGVLTGSTFTGRFPAAFSSADNIAAQTATAMHGLLYGWDSSGANWDRLQLDTSGFLKVSVQNSTLAVTQSGAWTVTANAGTNLNTSALALSATQTDGTQKSIVRGGAKGSTAAADVTSTASGANHNILDVAIYDGSGNQITTFGGGTQYTEDAVSAADPVGNQLIARRRDTLATETSADGDVTALNSTGKGELYVKHTDTITVTQGTGTNLHVVCDSGCSSSAGFADNSAFTFGTTAINPIGGVLDDTSTNTATENSAAVARITAQKALHMNLRNNDGTEIGTTSNPIADNLAQIGGSTVATLAAGEQKVGVEGLAASGTAKSGNPVQIGGVFNTTQPTVTTGQAVEAQATSRGELLIAKGVSGFSIDNTSFAATQSGTWTVQPGNTANTTPWLVRPHDGTTGASVIAGNNALKTDLSSVAGTNTITAGVAGLQAVGGAAASGASKSGNPVQVGGVFNSTQPTVTTGQAVEAQSTSRGALIVGTGVDTFNVTANAGTNLNTSALFLDATYTGRMPAGASPADNESNTNTALSRIGTFNYVFDGVTWDRWTGAVTGGGIADRSAFTAGTTAEFTAGGVYNESLGPETSGTTNAVRQTAYRANHGNLRDSKGQELGTQTNPMNVQISGIGAITSPSVLADRSQASIVTIDPFGNLQTTSTIGDGSGRYATLRGKEGSQPTDAGLVVHPSVAPALQCPRVAAINQTTNTEIATANGAQVYICTFSVISATAQSVSLVEGTGTTCGTGTAGLYGGATASVSVAANGGLVIGSDRITIPSQTRGDNICLLQSGAGNISGVLTYGLY